MAEAKAKLVRQSPLAAVTAPGDHGRLDGEPGVVFRDRCHLAVLSLMARPERRGHLAEAVQSGLGLALPKPNGSSEGEETSLLWFELDRWHVISETWSADRIAAALGDLASIAVVDQSHGIGAIEIHGPATRNLLAKATPIDVAQESFPVGATAATAMNHMSAHFWRRDEDRYLISLPRSFTRDLFEFLAEMALEFGYRIEA